MLFNSLVVVRAMCLACSALSTGIEVRYIYRYMGRIRRGLLVSGQRPCVTVVS